MPSRGPHGSHPVREAEVGTEESLRRLGILMGPHDQFGIERHGDPGPAITGMLGLGGQPSRGRLEIHQVESKAKHGARRPGPRPDLGRRRLRLCLGNGPGARREHCLRSARTRGGRRRG